MLHPAAKAALERFLAKESVRRGYLDSLALRFGGEFQGSVQTIGHFFARKLHFWHPAERVEYRRELVVMSDGGTVALDWSVLNNRERPLVFIHHGLCGNSQSVYVKHLVALLNEKGYDSVVLVARGCGGLALTTSSGFTAARTQDIREAIAHIHANCAIEEMFAVGFSLGAGLLLKYLGEERERASQVLCGAVAISPAFDFAVTPPHFDLWSKYRLVNGLIDWAKTHAAMLRPHPGIQWEKMLQAENVREFDQACVVGPYAYRDVDHYYFESSPIRLASQIQLPSLSLNALDDPVCSGSTVPPDGHEDLGPGLVSLVTQRGGHVAFAESLWPSTSWMDRVTLDWLESCRGKQEE